MSSNEMIGQTVFKSPAWLHEPRRSSPFGSLFSVSTLRQAALHIAEARRGNGFHTRDLVGLLISHAARNKRMVQPHTKLRMTLPVSFNKVSVRITIDQ